MRRVLDFSFLFPLSLLPFSLSAGLDRQPNADYHARRAGSSEGSAGVIVLVCSHGEFCWRCDSFTVFARK